MATNIKISVEDTSSQTMTITQDGAQIRIQLYWQGAPDENWYVDLTVRRGGQTYSKYGRRVLVDEALIELPSSFSLGTLYCRRRSENSLTTLTRDSFQTTHDLTYERA